MRCAGCSRINPDDATVCIACGEALGTVCPACGGSAPAGAAFCPTCGRALAPGDRVAERGSGDWGERRPATVLFSDLSGYTELNEALDPEDVAAVMGQIKDAVSRVVESHGGTVNQFVGDQVMALFGVPVAHDDDPVRAVQAALAFHGVLRDLALDLEQQIGRRLALHTAVNTGLVVAQRRDSREGVFGVTGDAINTGARLTSVAGPDEIVVGPDTYRAIEPYFVTEALGAIELRGKAHPVEAHRVVGVVARSHFEAARRRGLSRLVGRSRELAQLREHLSDLGHGKGALFALSGEPGVGKTRLFHEFGRLARQAGLKVRSARCEPFGNVTPLAPFVQLLREWIGLREDDSHDELVAKTVARVRDGAAELEPHLPVFLHLLSLRSAEHPLAAPLQGEALQDASFEAIAALWRIETRDEPLVLLLEDWHWADRSSELALRHLLPILPSLPLVLAVNYRSHLRPDWSAGRAMQLEPLAPPQAEELIASLLEPDRLTETRRRAISERTGGNPFFIEEVCRAVSETGSLEALEAESGAEPGHGGWLPDTVEAVVRARIDRLDRASIGVLRVAAVLGSQFSLPVLGQLAEEPNLGVALSTLRRADLVQEDPDLGEGGYRFKHDITRQVAYETLLRRDRRELHERAGHIIEELYGEDRLEAHFEELARHYSHGSDRKKAAFFLECAGNKAAQSFAMETALAHYAGAVRLLREADESREGSIHWMDLVFRWSQAGWWGPSTEQLEALKEARDVARSLGDSARELRSIYFGGWIQHAMGNTGDAVEHFELCLEMLDPSDDRLCSRLYCDLGANLANGADFDRALEFLERGIELRKRAFPKRWRIPAIAYALSYLATIHADRGNFERFDELIDDAVSMADELGQRTSLSSINQLRIIGETMRGDWEVGRKHASFGCELAGAIGARTNHGMALSLEGWCRFMARGEASGLAALREGIAEMEANSTRLGISLYYAYLAEGLARIGDLDGADEQVDRSLERIRVGEGYGEAAAYRARALARLLRADRAGALEALETARRLAEQKQSPRERALADLIHAECLATWGDAEASSARAGAAAAAFHGMGMKWYEARAREIGGPRPS